MHSFLKKVDDLFLVLALKTQAANAVSPSNKTNKVVRYGNIFIFCSHYYQSKAIHRAVDLPVRSFDLVCPGVALPLLQKNKMASPQGPTTQRQENGPIQRPTSAVVDLRPLLDISSIFCIYLSWKHSTTSSEFESHRVLSKY